MASLINAECPNCKKITPNKRAGSISINDDGDEIQPMHCMECECEWTLKTGNHDIEVIQDKGQAHQGDCVSVYTYPSPLDPTTRLAIVDATHWFDSTADASHGGVTKTKLVDMKPCSHKDAMRIAREYAIEHEIKRIYERKDD